jgi:HSP20 family protein
MALVRWNPYAEMNTLRRQMDRLFDEVAGIAPYEAPQGQPAVEFHDDGEHFTLKAQLPGLKPEDIDVSVMRDRVILSGEYRQEKKEKTRSEFYYGKFERTIGLPVAVQNSKVKADFTNGILTLTLPKVEEAVNKVVKVNLAGAEKPAIEGEADAQ